MEVPQWFRVPTRDLAQIDSLDHFDLEDPIIVKKRSGVFWCHTDTAGVSSLSGEIWEDNMGALTLANLDPGHMSSN